MTLLAFDSWVDVTASERRRDYKVGPRCANPFCSRWADHGHHIQRRSFFGHGVECSYITLGHFEIGNLTGLCHVCHNEVTENRSQIHWSEDGSGFRWREKTDGVAPILSLPLLRYQPPIRRLGAAGATSPTPIETPGSAEPSQLTIDGGEVPHAAVGGEDTETCPTCHGAGKRARRLKSVDGFKPGPRREKKRWSLWVPVDHRENGVEIVEGLLEQVRDLLGRRDHKSWRYYTLVEALVLLVQHKDFVFSEEEDAA